MNSWERRLKVTTPESLALDLELAGPGARFLAFLLDLIVIIAILYLVTSLLGTLLGSILPGLGDDDTGFLAVAIAYALIILIEFGLFFGYWFVSELAWNGQTLGKKAAGIRVVMLGGFPVTTGAALIRNLIRLIDMLPPPICFVGLSSMVLSKNYQRLGDIAAGTVVVRARAFREGTGMLFLAGLNPESLLHWDTNAISAREIELIRRFLARRFLLRPAARYSVGRRLAMRYGPKVTGPPRDLPPEVLLEGIITARQIRAARHPIPA